MTGPELREFWRTARQELDRTPPGVTMEPWGPPADPMQRAAYTNPYTPTMQANVARGWVGDGTVSYWKVGLASVGGIRVCGWYMTPTEPAPPGGWPALLTVPGYSETMGSLGQILVHFGYAVLALFPRGQGESRAEWQLEEATKLTYHLDERNRYYYRGAYLDCIRGVDFLCSRPEVDLERIGMFGISQGGGFTLATASLESRIRAAVAWIPLLCNFPVAIDLQTAPYNELNAYVAGEPDRRRQALETLQWYDPLNLVEGIVAPTLVSIGGADLVCPESTVMPVFQRIGSQKAMIHLPQLEHGSSVEYPIETLKWFERYL